MPCHRQRRAFRIPAERGPGPTTIPLSTWRVSNKTRLRVTKLVLPTVSTAQAADSDAVLLVLEGADAATMAPHVFRSVDGATTVRYTLAVPLVQGSTTTHTAGAADGWDAEADQPYSVSDLTVRLVLASSGAELDFDAGVEHSILLEIEWA